MTKIGKKWEALIEDDAKPFKDKFVSVGNSMFKAIENLLIILVTPSDCPIRIEFRLVEDGFLCFYRNHESFGVKIEIALAGIVERIYNECE